MGQSVRASEKGLAIANQARQRLGWTKTSTACWWQDAHTSRATLRRFWRGERIQQDAFIAICQAVGLSNWQEIAELALEPRNEESLSFPCLIDWGEAPDIEQFYGREQELQQLQTWVNTAKLITISGLGGTGKTTLAIVLAEQQQTEFEQIIWRSSNVPLETLLTDVLETPSETVEQGVKQLLKTMQHRRLIILDAIESHIHLDFLYRISRSRHRSCLLVISRQPLPTQFQTLNRSQQISLSGFSPDAAVKLLRTCGCRGQLSQLKTLARLYGHNPLALKLVASTIKTVFNGQIAPFLDQETIILPDPIRLLFQQQFKALEPLEKTILFWLAIWQEPISLCRLQTHLLSPDPATTMTSLSTLVQRSLVTQHFLADQPSFSLQPMIMTFFINELAAAIAQEILQAHSTQDFELLKTHCIVRPGTDDILGDRVLAALQKNYQNQIAQPLSESISTWLQQAKLESSSTVGYLIFNLTILAKRFEATG
ncbi:hypothetical protein IQ260_20360 [Leptolyngbya cf. ectocarpi LEGE 11479]|uniref:NB-ARC domain-containing protein n=1 Tax=Leptolyngbya cf. ectocarpi LEGE 11479 TaxID=1828722 RepID=A0A928ZX07_LEPEC|nr:NB-ARC domain-containing protein [Leptolyngbya ectocarpi]MBE9069001.1 hypothetical protein [Leptolyngbya cf. ectocarpi LEGE 11479]